MEGSCLAGAKEDCGFGRWADSNHGPTDCEPGRNSLGCDSSTTTSLRFCRLYSGFKGFDPTLVTQPSSFQVCQEHCGVGFLKTSPLAGHFSWTPTNFFQAERITAPTMSIAWKDGLMEKSKDQDRTKGAMEQDAQNQGGNTSMQGQLGHREQDADLKDADADQAG